MNFCWTKIIGTLVIVAMLLSVGLCAYTSSMAVNMDEMNVPSVAVGHIDHAFALILAVIPSIQAGLALLCLLFIFFLQDLGVAEKTSFLYSLIEPVDSSQSKLRRYLFNPRSPPVC